MNLTGDGSKRIKNISNWKLLEGLDFLIYTASRPPPR